MAAQKPRILIVDDEPEACRLFSMMLALQGYRTEIASNGLEALNRLRRDPPDVIFLDVTLPGVDGLSVCREIRATPALAKLPIVLVSAKSEKSLADEGLKAGADAYVGKPVALDEVLKAIEKAMAAHDIPV